jgi:hypothetical protein
VSQSLSDPVALSKLLDLVISTVVSSSGNYERVGAGYEKLIDLDELKAAALELAERQPNNEENVVAISRFVQALENSRQRPSF